MTVTLDFSTMHVISALAMSLSRLIKVPDASLQQSAPFLTFIKR